MKICKQCHKSFEPDRKWQTLCSPCRTANTERRQQVANDKAREHRQLIRAARPARQCIGYVDLEGRHHDCNAEIGADPRSKYCRTCRALHQYTVYHRSTEGHICPGYKDRKKLRHRCPNKTVIQSGNQRQMCPSCRAINAIEYRVQYKRPDQETAQKNQAEREERIEQEDIASKAKLPKRSDSFYAGDIQSLPPEKVIRMLEKIRNGASYAGVR